MHWHGKAVVYIYIELFQFFFHCQYNYLIFFFHLIQFCFCFICFLFFLITKKWLFQFNSGHIHMSYICRNLSLTRQSTMFYNYSHNSHIYFSYINFFFYNNYNKDITTISLLYYLILTRNIF